MGTSRRAWQAAAACALIGCLPDTSGFTLGDGGAATDGAASDGGRSDAALDDGGARDGSATDLGTDMFVPPDCGGTPCIPPGPRCQAGAVVTSTGGRCESGTCVFDEASEPCAFGCAAGACEPEPCVSSGWGLSDVPGIAVDFSSDVAHVADASGGDHLAYVSTDGVHYLHRVAGGGWTDEAVEAAGPGTLQSETAIGLDAAGRPHIAFARWNDEIVHAERGTPDWTTTLVGNGSNPGVVGTPDGSIHLVYEGSGLRHAVRAPGGTEWTTDALRRTDGGFTRAAHGDGLVLLADGAGTLHVVFTDFAEDDLSHARLGTAWTFETIHPALVLPSAFDATLDGAGGVHVSFSDDAGNDLQYAYRAAAGSWTLPAPVHADVQRMGDPNAIAVSPGGAIHIVYRDEFAFDVRYATRPAGGSFTHELLDGTNGFAAGAYADGAGRLRLIYRAAPGGGGDVLRIAEKRDCP